MQFDKAKRIQLDVSQLAPPEPMERILDVLANLKSDEYLEVKHQREPFPLYPMLEDMGFNWQCNQQKTSDYEILIWANKDNKN